MSAQTRISRRSPALRRRLIGLDVAVLSVGWSIALPLSTGPLFRERVVAAAVSVAATVLMLALEGMYRRRVASVRTLEIKRSVRAVWTANLLVGVAGAVVEVRYGIRQALVAAVVLSICIVLSRGLFRYWLMRERAGGRYRQRLLVVGADPRADEWIVRFEEHPELGFDLVGVVGAPSADSIAGRMAVQRDPVRWASDVGADSVLVVSQAFSYLDLTELVHRLVKAGLYVQLTSPGGGLLASRMRMQTMVSQPLMFVDPIADHALAQRAKRALDVVLSAALLVICAPLLVLASLAVMAGDRGPVFFRQTRIGFRGREFTMLKLRTMAEDSEQRLAEVRSLAGTERDGPLFKLENDPRFTRVGRVLDRLSINELPQLWNVLRGEMSLVGPRPALPEEHVEFDTDLQRRVTVRPGITGLWQVESREAPSFESYRRLDLQYVDNWSLSLDFVILVATIETVLGRSMVLGAAEKPELTVDRAA